MIIGRFYFIQTENGNLLGEYSNQLSVRNTPESAEMVDRNGLFFGNYNSTWFEQNDNSPILMRLRISPKDDSAERIYRLEWTENAVPQFRGEGFIVNGILVGNYWDIDLENRLNQGF